LLRYRAMPVGSRTPDEWTNAYYRRCGGVRTVARGERGCGSPTGRGVPAAAWVQRFGRAGD